MKSQLENNKTKKLQEVLTTVSRKQGQRKGKSQLLSEQEKNRWEPSFREYIDFI